MLSDEDHSILHFYQVAVHFDIYDCFKGSASSASNSEQAWPLPSFGNIERRFKDHKLDSEKAVGLN